MASGLQSAQAGMTCKIVPGWCPPPEHQVTTTASTNTNNVKTETGTPSFDRGGSDNPGSNNQGWNPGSNNPGSDHHEDHGPTSVPEPATLLLLGAGVSAVGAATLRRRKRK